MKEIRDGGRWKKHKEDGMREEENNEKMKDGKCHHNRSDGEKED